MEGKGIASLVEYRSLTSLVKAARPGRGLFTLAIVAGLAYWFGIRGPTDTAPVSGDSAGERARPAAGAAPETPEAEKLQPVPVMVLTSEAEDTARTLIVRGRTEANRKVAVSAETTGLVVSQPLRRGATVERGRVLCELAPGARLAQLLEAEAVLARAQVNFDAAAQLSERGFTAETTRIARSAELEAAQATVERVKWDISRLHITAPFSGILESDTAELGARLAPGETCADLIDLSTVKVTGFVGEQNIDLIRLHRDAVARMINGREEVGKITFISRVADEDTRTYMIQVTLENADRRLRDGMTSELLIDLPPVRAHRIPKSALTLDDGGRLGLRLAEGRTSRFHPVEVIRDEPRGAWVTGLPSTATVIVVGQEFVGDGREIRPFPVTWDDLG